ncbi:MAG: hypothetical protein FWD61_04690 [Phycisphaerales bacterium]|nr:hypothetical protein [Phycisphaerales bacterium]
MAIDFDTSRWAKVKGVWSKWWVGELKRPLVAVELVGRDPGRPEPAAPMLDQSTCADLSIPAEALVDRLDWELSRRIYLGDAFPVFEMLSFGPGVLAAMIGGKLDNATGRVWFHPGKKVPIKEMHFEYNASVAENVWLRRIKELCAAMMKRWQGQVLVGMTDLGGNMDVLSTFWPGEELLLLLCDQPEEVRRVLWEVHEVWHRVFAEIHAVLQPVNPGYTSWCWTYSDRPYYMLQCDFCYMISPEMFGEFVLPELAASARRLDRCCYHLDGKGQLPHLDAILAEPRIGGVQWVPGAGAPDGSNWPEIYRRIFAAGKRAQIGGKLPAVYEMLKRTGIGPGVHLPRLFPMEVERYAREWVDKLMEWS